MSICKRCGMEFETLAETDEDFCDACLEDFNQDDRHDDDDDDHDSASEDQDFSWSDVGADDLE